jgi:hypothetical protein
MTKPTTPDIELTSIGGSMPTQAEGRMLGYPFYYRSRHGFWRLAVAKPGDLTDLFIGISEIWAKEGEDRFNGCVPIPFVIALIKQCCLEFKELKIDEAYLQKVEEDQCKRIEKYVEALRNGSIEKHLEAFRNRKGNKP